MNQAPYDSASTVAPELSARAISERRQARIWLGLLAFGALLWLFGSVHYTYQTRRSADGRIVRLAGEGPSTGPVGPAYMVRFLTTATDRAGVIEEITAMMPYAIERATVRGDTVVDVVAVRRFFKFGLFAVDKDTHMRAARIKGNWTPL